MNKYQEFQDLVSFQNAFDYNHDNDREIVIVGCAYIENLIKSTLAESLKQDTKEINLMLDEGSGAMPGLVQRSRMLYLMGVFPKVIFEDIKLVARIRNHFAHNVAAAFMDEFVIKSVHKLKWHIEAGLGRLPPPDATVRDIYQVGVNQLVCHLNGLPSFARYNRNGS